jgi:hypothetical protein
MAVLLSALRSGIILPSSKDPLALISVRGLVKLERLGKVKKFNDLIGARTRDLWFVA